MIGITWFHPSVKVMKEWHGQRGDGINCKKRREPNTMLKGN
jgi:hypothetical protein